MIRVALPEVTLDWRVVKEPALGIFEENTPHPHSRVKAVRESVRSRNNRVSVAEAKEVRGEW